MCSAFERPGVSLPPVAPGNVRTALEQAVGRLLSDENVYGLAVFGSVARGEAEEHSDIDLSVLVAEGQARTEQWQLEDVAVHVAFARAIPSEGRDRVRWLMKPPFADAGIIYDPRGVLQQLKEVDTRLAARGPAPVTPADRALIRAEYREHLRVMEILDGDQAAQRLAIDEMVSRLLATYLRYRGHWWKGRRWVLPLLRQTDPEIAELAAQTVTSPTVERAVATLGLLAERVLQPLGGIPEPGETISIPQEE